jgi:hypothetical protein
LRSGESARWKFLKWQIPLMTWLIAWENFLPSQWFQILKTLFKISIVFMEHFLMEYNLYLFCSVQWYIRSVTHSVNVICVTKAFYFESSDTDTLNSYTFYLHIKKLIRI